MDPRTRHSDHCRRAFSNLDPDCARCIELKAGATRRQWGRARAQTVVGAYCFCPNTSLAARRCGTCGRPPYTD